MTVPRTEADGRANAPERTFRAGFDALKAAQKTSKGAPAYSRFVNRPFGRALAAIAYVLGRTPNQLTVLSAACTYSALAIIALVEPASMSWP